MKWHWETEIDRLRARIAAIAEALEIRVEDDLVGQIKDMELDYLNMRAERDRLMNERREYFTASTAAANARIAELEAALEHNNSALDGANAIIEKLEADTFERWKRCPSTHCERRGECASPHECIIKPKPPELEPVKGARIAELEDKLSTAVWSRDHERADNGALRKRVAELEARVANQDIPAKLSNAIGIDWEAAFHREKARAEKAETALAVAQSKGGLKEKVALLASENGCLRAELSQTKRDLKDWQDSSEAYRHDAEKAEADCKRAEAVLHLYAEAQRWATGTEEHRLALQKADTYRAALAPSPAGREG